MYLMGVDDRTKDKLMQIIGFQVGSFPFHYLGTPLAMEKLHTSNYGALTDVIVRQLI